MKTLSALEFKRRVFNKALTEAFCTIHDEVLKDDSQTEESLHEKKVAKSMCEAFFTQTLDLDTSTITATKKRLGESVTYIQDMVSICEAIAEDKADDAQKSDLEMDDDQQIELSPEDKSLLDTLFNTKTPLLQVDKIRDATVKALLAEDKKAEEIRNSIDIAKSEVAVNKNEKSLEETINRLNGRGPTSLMNAILNNVAVSAVKDVTSNGNFKSVQQVMKENADTIKNRAAMVYSLYEMASVFGIQTYTQQDIKKLAADIYHGK